MSDALLGTLEELVRGGVRFVLIGGLAANVHGSPTTTRDVDVCYQRTDENLARLAAVLQRLGARLRGAPEGLPFLLDEHTLRAGDSFTFETNLGPLDILGTPAGTRGYPELAANAEEYDLGQGLRVTVCALEDLIRMKAAAGRPKDRIELEVLGALRDELERRGD